MSSAFHFSLVMFAGLLASTDPLRGDEYAWITGLRNASTSTKELLQTCLLSVDGRFESLWQLHFLFEVEMRQFQPDETFIRRAYEGVAYRRGESLRYDYRDQESADQNAWFTVLRLQDMAVITEWNPNYGPFFTIRTPPPLEEWQGLRQHLTVVDQEVHFFPSFRSKSPTGLNVRRFCEVSTKIESAREDPLVVLRFEARRSDQEGSYAELQFDPAKEFLPVRVLEGAIVNGKVNVIKERSYEWQNHPEGWYLSCFSQDVIVGWGKLKYRQFDVKLKEVQLNEAAKIPPRVFELDDIRLPDKAQGVDLRKDPTVQMIKVGGRIRPRNPGENVELPPEVLARIEADRQQRLAAVSGARGSRSMPWILAGAVVGAAVGVVAFLVVRSWRRRSAKAA